MDNKIEVFERKVQSVLLWSALIQIGCSIPAAHTIDCREETLQKIIVKLPQESSCTRYLN